MKSSGLLLIIITVLVLPNCKTRHYSTAQSGNNTDSLFIQPSDSVSTFRELAIAKMGTNTRFEFNETGEYVLCYTLRKTNIEVPNNQLQFIIYQVTDNEMIYEDQLYHGSAEWIKDYVVKVILKPEMVMKNPAPGETGYYYHVKERKVIPLQ